MKDFILNSLLSKHVICDDYNSLDLYLDLCTNYNEVISDDDYCEIHHILPRVFFPEYTNESWNKVVLKYEDHKKAHSLLFDSFNIRTYQKPLLFFRYKKSKKQISNAARRGWVNLRNDKSKYDLFVSKRSAHMKTLTSDEQHRRAMCRWDNLTEDEKINLRNEIGIASRLFLSNPIIRKKCQTVNK